MSDDSAGFALRGTFMHAPRRDEIEILEDAVISVDGAGAIDALHRPGEAGHAAAVAEGRRRGTLTSLGEGRCLLPGLVDLHIHAPQWPQLGKSLHLPLEDWLVHCTFPLEAKYADAAFAERVYASLVETVLANGTTTAVYHATVHLESTMRLADICLARGQRAFVGKVAMDHPDQCPDYYRDESATAAIEGSRSLIAYVRALPGNESGLVRPIITPRFIPSCTDPLLEGLGILAGESACPVQTHCSESDWQHGFVLERYGRTDNAKPACFRPVAPRHDSRPRQLPERGGHGHHWAGRRGHCPLPALELLLFERRVSASRRPRQGGAGRGSAPTSPGARAPPSSTTAGTR